MIHPKMEIKDGRIIRYVVGRGEEDIGAPPAVDIAFYEQNSAPEREASLPDGYTLERFTVRPSTHAAAVNASRTRGDIAEYSLPQFHALYSLVGASSGWWPLVDKGWDSGALFNHCELYALKNETGIPVAFSAIERDVDPDTPGTNKIVFIGVAPSQQGKGIGGRFFDVINQIAWKNDTQKVVLDTVPEFDLMKGGAQASAAATLYEKRGFNKIGNEYCVPDDPSHFNQFNIPAFYIDNPEYTPERLEKEVARLFSPKKQLSTIVAL